MGGDTSKVTFFFFPFKIIGILSCLLKIIDSVPICQLRLEYENK